MSYYTVIVPWVPHQFQTEWHPTIDVGPFSTLQRGAFETVAEAIKWAQKNLNGTPYTIRAAE